MENTKQPETPAPARVTLAGIEFDVVTEAQANQYVLSALDRGEGGHVITPNLHILRNIQRDMAARAIVQNATLCVADGMPLVWACRLAGTPLPERVAGSSMIWTLNQLVAEHAAHRRVYLLGGEDQATAELAAEVLRKKYPGLQIVGVFSPPFGFDQDEAMMAQIAQQVRDAKPDIVFMGLGYPKQEHAIKKFREVYKLGEEPMWWLGVGMSINFVAGRVKRAPRWMQVSGLEWIHRLCQEPRRLFKRYLCEGLPFAGGLMARALMRRMRGGSSTQVRTALDRAATRD